MTRLLRLVVAGAAVAAVVAACSSGDSSSDSDAAATATSSATAPGSGGAGSSATAAIAIKDFAYGAPLTVAPGTTVTVTNQDVAGHDVVSDDEGKFRTPVLEQGESGTFTAPTEPGTYKFSCSLHPGSMSGIGTLVVQG